MPRLLSSFRNKHRGAALLMILIIMVVGAAFLLSALNSNPQIERDKVTADALAQAKEALIGYAATYRDNNASDVFGFLPLPDLGSTRNGTPEEGNAAGSFLGNTTNLTVIGKLPWRTLGLPALRDSKGECLWYAVSGSFQNVLKTSAMNWDTLGHFDVFSSDGTPGGTISTTGNNLHQRPVAIIFSAGAVLAGQDRLASGDTVATCGGNYDVRNYLDSFNADANINNIVNHFTGPINNATGYAYSLTGVADGSQLSAAALAAPKSIISGNVVTNLGNIVNDRALVITADEIFSRIRRRNDFATDITTMLADLATCLNAMPVASLPTPNGNKGIGSNLETSCPPLAVGTQKGNVYANWKENLLYARPGGTITVNGASCNAALIFGGERTAGQVRASSTDKANAAMYLEGGNAASFPNGTAYTGAGAYSAANPAADVAICITGSGGGGGSWPFEYPTQWAGVPALDAAAVAVGGGTSTTGTSGNDDVRITGNLTSWINLGSGNDELLVTGNFTGGGSFGPGDDTVKIGGYSSGSIDLGSGNDYLDIGGNSSGYIDAGAGNDKVRIGGDVTASIALGSGDDELHILGSASSSIDAGSGSDKIRIDGNMGAYIDLGNDDDYLVIIGNSQGVQAGSGDDIVLIGGNATNWLDLGSGNDYLEILGNSAGLDAGGGDDIVKITGNATNTINLGAGDDYLRVGGTITWIDGGSGADRVQLTNYSTGDCATLLSSRIAGNVEHVKVSNGMCRGSDFTFP